MCYPQITPMVADYSFHRRKYAQPADLDASLHYLHGDDGLLAVADIYIRGCASHSGGRWLKAASFRYIHKHYHGGYQREWNHWLE